MLFAAQLPEEDKRFFMYINKAIVRILKQNFKFDINPSQIQPLKEIKTIGVHNILINLHSEVQVKISIKVLSEESTK